MFNMPNYSYPRAHHYHFYLDDFPRIEGQLSYALDNDNAFGLTYSKDQTVYYRGQVQSEILNRVAFTLPEKDNDKEAFPNHQ